MVDLHLIEYHLERTMKKTKEETFPRNEDNWKYIMSYLKHLRLYGGKKGKPAKSGTLLKHCHVLRWYSERIGKLNFTKVSHDRLTEIILDIEMLNDVPFAKHRKKMVLKGFYNYLSEVHRCEVNLRKLNTKMPKSTKRKSEDMLSPEQIKDMIYPERGLGATKSIKERAMLAVAFEALPRPGELLQIRMKDIDLSVYPAKIHIPEEQSKTCAHDTYLSNDVGAIDLLKDYLRTFPKAPDDRIFDMSYFYANKRVKNIAERVLERKIPIYLFRHSRITYLRFLGIPKEIIQSMAGQNSDGDVIEDYTHIGRQHVMPWLSRIPKVTSVTGPSIAEHMSHMPTPDLLGQQLTRRPQATHVR